MPIARAVDKIQDVITRGHVFLRTMLQASHEPHETKQLDRLFTPGEASQMVGRDRSTLVKAEPQLGFQLQRKPSNRREGYTLERIQRFREHFGTLPWRDPSDPCLYVAFQNFKGGVGKSTNCLHVAHGLALKGYRVLVVDADHQATTTSMFGYLPDKDLAAQDTFLPYLMGDQTDLRYAVRTTHWPNIDLIPACMALSDAEIGIILYLADKQLSPQQRVEFFRELRAGFDSVAEHYDVVLIDSPPSNGMIALSVLIAADCLVVPCGPEMFDFTSTLQFLQMISEYIQQVDPQKAYRWVRVLVSKFDSRVRNRYGGHQDFLDSMRANLGDITFSRVIAKRAAISNAATNFRTIYEPSPSDRSNKDVLEMMDGVVDEIELALTREWPSKRDVLLKKGIA